MVIYRFKLHAALKRNFQLIPALKWLRLHMPGYASGAGVDGRNYPLLCAAESIT